MKNIIYDSFEFKRLVDSELINFIPVSYISDYHLESYCCEFYLDDKRVAMVFCPPYIGKDVELNKRELNLTLLN